MNNFINLTYAILKLHSKNYIKKNVRTSEKRVFNKKIYAILEFNFKIA